MHDALTVAVPVLVILFGILLNQRGLDKVEARLDRMQSDMAQFYRVLGEHSAKIDVMMDERRK